MDILTGLLALALTLLILCQFLIKKRPHNLPPGPKGWPFFGNILQISSAEAYKDFLKLSKKYGDIMTMNMAGKDVIVLNSCDVIREAFFNQTNRDVFAGRPSNFYSKYSDQGPSVLFTTFSKEMLSQRKVFMQSLKMYGPEGQAIQKTIADELQAVVEKIREFGGKPFDLSRIIIPSLTNIILILLSGKRFKYDDPELLAAMAFEKYNVEMLDGQVLAVLTAFPFLRHIPFGYGKLYKGHRQAYDKLIYYFHTLRKARFDPETSRGLVAELMRLQPTTPWLTDEKIHGALRDYVGAGIGTTRGTILSFFLVMLHKPEVMSQVQNEIDAVIGRDRRPAISDKKDMPYTEAAVMELLRYISHVPLGATHSTMSDVTLRGYHIPANSTVIANLWTAHHDERIWEDPWEYKPERFLDADGNVVPPEHKNRQNWLVFSTGRRACVGEQFGRSRAFLYITTLLQQFNFRSCAEHQLPSHDPRGYTGGLTIHPPRYHVIVENRK